MHYTVQLQQPSYIYAADGVFYALDWLLCCKSLRSFCCSRCDACKQNKRKRNNKKVRSVHKMMTMMFYAIQQRRFSCFSTNRKSGSHNDYLCDSRLVTGFHYFYQRQYFFEYFIRFFLRLSMADLHLSLFSPFRFNSISVRLRSHKDWNSWLFIDFLLNIQVYCFVCLSVSVNHPYTHYPTTNYKHIYMIIEPFKN